MPHEVLQTISQAKLPCFVYDGAAVKQRAELASSLLDRCFFPIKACPEPDIVRAALAAGCGLDLCSEGDAEIASSVGCPADRWKFTSARSDGTLLRRLCEASVLLDADSLEQALHWKNCGGTVCGLRITAKQPKALYGAKFGIPVGDIVVAARRLEVAGVRLEGLHLHDQHTNLTPVEFATRLAETLAQVDSDILRGCRYVNIGGSWPMRHSNPASAEDLRHVLGVLRERLAAIGFKGALYGEPGRWIVGPCGYWAARVAAVKAHPQGKEHRVVVLDTNTPVPCRPSLAPFVVLRDGDLLKAPRCLTCDIFGSSNTALDSIGVDVRLPALDLGDVVVSLGQGAYTRSLIPPFNERERPAAIVLDEGPASSSLASDTACGLGKNSTPGVFVFNPFAEGCIAQGKAFTPVKHQAMLAKDLANLPQFLCQPDDIVLLVKRPSVDFQSYLKQAGFPLVEFVELREGRIDPNGSLCQRKLGHLRPWAWGPDSIILLETLFGRVAGDTRSRSQYFNDEIARLYSKAWSAGFLRKVLARCRGGHEVSCPGAEAHSSLSSVEAESWLCTEQEAGIAVDTLEELLETITAIRSRGHHRVVVKEAYGLAGHNAIRLWEPEVLPAQRQWLTHALRHSRQLVVEPWLERELDFSVQLEMGRRGLRLCGYTGLVNDRKGQFLANWAEADYMRCLPAKVAALFRGQTDISGHLQRLYGKIFSMLEAELQRVGFAGPVSIDALVYRTPQGDCRLKPVVEINPRYTMGRLSVELMKHTCPGSCGLFRLVTQAEARTEGFDDLSSYACFLRERVGLRLEGEPAPKIRQGALCLNDPGQAQVCLATFEVSSTLNLRGSLSGNEHQRSH
jgi:diaminopimelate decarboxylase